MSSKAIKLFYTISAAAALMAEHTSNSKATANEWVEILKQYIALGVLKAEGPVYINDKAIALSELVKTGSPQLYLKFIDPDEITISVIDLHNWKNSKSNVHETTESDLFGIGRPKKHVSTVRSYDLGAIQQLLNGTHELLPLELQAALKGWLYQINQNDTSNIRNSIRAYLDTIYTDDQISKTKKNHISSIANWNKSGNR
ncbi:hypothetical protein [Vibrio algivorus]|uniref:Uncharacterized protein n=1 Tax=Vibrio algivorus TaxID=1667024 RepID=A0A557P6E3_9VIBR|nr:hypothetical protein [Vibrio algivorus]TVO36197.1 hypothetical protein FOF44_09810 [Vibrio algivorus]